ncbi:MAG: Cna B-type domain-containing protein [Oscillospiraceae bacterium]|nr:Cna B-type domain-containing protein [Oscillospiraceae bacterium]
MNKKTHTQRIASIFLSLLIGFQNVPLTALAEGDDWLGDDNPSGVAEEFTEEHNEALEDEYDSIEAPEENEYRSVSMPFDHLYFNDGLVESIDFSNKRLLVGTDNKSIFTWNTNVISEYDGVYLLSFESEAEAMSAYTYYYDIADFVESDIALSVSGKAASADNGIDAMSQLSVLLNSEDGEEGADYDIALIDTGAEGELVKSVSVIGGSAGDDNGHGTSMLDAIRSVSPELSVLSIKAFDSNGAGSMSSVYAAMIYAIENGVDVIDLSFAAKSVTDSAVLDRTAALAQRKGISVVGAAGDDGEDVSGYLPGRAAGVYIAGACDKKGKRYSMSNYGDKVFCSAAAETTSEAAAKLSAVMAANGIENTYRELNNGIIFEKDKTHKYKEYTKLVEVPASDSILPGLTGVGVMPVSVFNRGIFPILEEDEENSDTGENSDPDEEDSSAAGSVTIEYLNLKWLTNGAGTGRLELSPDDEDLSNQQFQISFAVTGQQTHKAGTIEISFPASIWEDRTGAEYGTLTLSVPEEPATGAEFAWHREGDRIIITNIRDIAASSTIMLQGTFRNMKATDIVDGTESEPLQVTVKVQTPEGKVASRTSNEIDASVDTYVEVTKAEKTAYNYTSGTYNIWWEERPGDMPEELLEALPGGSASKDEYVYVRWYVSGEAKGSQPFKMYVDDTIAGEFGGVMLGVSNCAEGTVVSADGKSVHALLFDGYSTTAKTAYVWTAYKKSEFPEGTKDMSVLHNTQTISVEGWDDKEQNTEDEHIHEMSADATAETRRPITYKVVKEWKDNDNAAGNRPNRLGVHIYRDEYSLKKVWHTELLTAEYDKDGDPNTWEYEWTDSGQDSTFRVTETLYDYTGPLYEWFGDEQYRKGTWGYYWESVNQVSDTEWRLVNKYYENGSSSQISRVDKIAKSPFDDSDPESKKDGLSLNKLLIGQDVYVPYDITASISAANDYIKNPGTEREFILEDADYTLQNNKELTVADLDIGAITISSINAYGYDLENGKDLDSETEGEGSVMGGKYYPSTTVDWKTVTLLGQTERGGEWIALAALQKNGIWNSENSGVEISDLGMKARITLPNGISGIRLVTEAEAAYVKYACKVELRLHPTDAIKEMIETAFGDGSETRACFDLVNEANIYTAYNDADGVRREYNETGHSRKNLYNIDAAYLHGRPIKVAAELEKSFEMPKDDPDADADKELRRIKLHSTLNLTQQSNITDKSEYDHALSNGSIPNASAGTYYDLLPNGVDPDLDSVKVSGNDKVIRKYVIQDYKGSGRTLLVVEVELSDNISYTAPGKDGEGKDVSTKYPNDETYPAGGYKNTHTLEFNSYVSRDEAYDNNGGMKKYRNVSAFEAAEDEIGNSANWSGEPDDPRAGKHQQSLGAVGDDADLMTDLDSGSDRSSFVYAGAELKNEEIDYDSMAGLQKRVQELGTGKWSTGIVSENYSAVNVQESGLYKYSLTVTSGTDSTTSNIILMDFLESYRPTASEEGHDDKIDPWRGSLVSVDISSLTGLGVKPVVYYCITPLEEINNIDYYDKIKDSDALAEHLESSSDWTTSPADMSAVTAVAIDMRYKEDGSDFKLEDNQRAIVYLNMRAPYDYKPGVPSAYLDGDGTDPDNNAHAYNNSRMTCKQKSPNSDEREDNLPSNYTKVGIYTKAVEIEKLWDDDEDRDGKRPGKIKVKLSGNGKPVEDRDELELSDNNDWKGSFERLRTYDEDGKYIIYDYEEEFVYDEGDDYTDDYTKSIDRTEQENGKIKIINSYEPEKISIPVTKAWLGDEGDITTRPDKIKVYLYSDENPDEVLDTKEIYPDENGNWSVEFTDLNKYRPKGELITYYVEEEIVTDYVFEGVEGNAENGFTISNRYYPKGDLRIGKTVVGVTDASKDQEFEFELALWYGNKEVEGDSGPLTDKYSYSICDSDGNVLKDKDGNDRTGTIGNGDHFFLQGGEHIVIKDIPTHVEIDGVRKDVSYSVTEMSASGFELTGVVGDTGSIVSWAAAEAEFTNTYTTNGTAQVKAKKLLEGRTLEPYKFSFELVDEKGDVITGRNNAAGDVTFRQLTYTKDDDGKTFTYILREVIPENADEITSEEEEIIGYYKDGYTYDITEYKVKVTVNDNGDGTMKCDVEYFGPDGNSLGFTEIDGKKYPVTPEFNNSYKTEGNVALRAWKTINSGGLSGDAYALKDNQFKFVLYDMQKNTISTARNDGKGVIDFQQLNFTQADAGNTYWYFVREQYDGTQPAAIFDYDKRIIGYRITVIDNGDGTLSFDQDSYDMSGAFTKCEDCKGAGAKAGETCEDCHGFGYVQTGDLSAPADTYRPMFTNGFADGSLSIAKAVTGTNPPAGAEFKFKVKLIGDDIKAEQSFEYTITGNGSERTETAVTDENGEFIITLHGGETALFEDNIPAGTAYQISEETPDGWDLIEYTNASGVIVPKATSRASFTNSYDPNMTTAVIIGSKYLDNQPAAEGSFTFELRENGKVIETVTVKAGGFIQFEPIRYESAGTYVYEVYEVNGGDPDINYDTHVETVTVTVTEDASGLHAKVEYEKDGMRFDNYTAPGGLEISKIGEGLSDTNKDTLFKFKVKFTNENGMPVSGEDITWYIKDADGNMWDSSGNQIAFGTTDEEGGEDKQKMFSTYGGAIASVGDLPAPLSNDEPSAIAAGDTVANGKSGSVLWSVIGTGQRFTHGGTNYEGYILRLEPEEGKDEGTLASWSNSSGVPWWSYGRPIISVEIEGTIYTSPEGNPGLFSTVSATKLDLAGLDISRTTGSLSQMFSDCVYLTDVTIYGSGACNASSMSNMFNECYNLTNVTFKGITEFNVPNMASMFYCYSNGCTDITINGMHKITTNDLGTMFGSHPSLKHITFNDLQEVNAPSTISMFGGCTNLETLTFNGGTVFNVDNMTAMFAGHKKLTTVNFNGASIRNTSNVSSMFNSCVDLTTINGADTLIDFSENENSSIDMSRMFYNCSALKSLDVSGWDLDCSGKIDMGYFFHSCTNLTGIDGIKDLNMSRVKNIRYMFEDCTSITSLDLSGWDLSSAVSVDHVFAGSGVTELNISDWRLESISDIGSNFLNGCSNMETVYMDNWKSESLKTVSSVFSNTGAPLKTVYMRGWKSNSIEKVTTVFNSGYYTVETVYMSDWEVRSVKSIDRVFLGCTTVTSIDMSGWKVGSALNSIEYLFCNAGGLETLDVSGWEGLVPGTVNGNYAFYGDNNANGDKRLKNLKELTIDSAFASSLYKVSLMPDVTEVEYMYTGKWVNKEELGDLQAPAYTSSGLFDMLSGNNVPKTTYVWQRACYEVRFEPGEGGGTMSPIQTGCYSNEPYALPANAFYNPGYIFTGWKDETIDKFYPADGSGVAVIPEGTYKHQDKVTLVAQWAKEDEVEWVYYTAEYMQQNISGGGYTSAGTTQYRVVKSAGTVTVIIIPEDIKGFKTPEPQTLTIIDGVVQGETPVKFYYDRIRYTIHFEGNGATAGSTNDIEMCANVDALLRNGFIKSNSAFIEWNTQPDGNGTSYSADIPTSIEDAQDGETYTLYAQWMTIDSSDKTSSYGEITITCKAGQTIVFPSLPAGTQYEIVEIDIPAGWSWVESESNYGDVDINGVITGGIMSNVVSLASVTNKYSATGIANIVAHKLFEGGELTVGAFVFELSSNEDFALNDQKDVLLTASNNNVDWEEFTTDAEGNTIHNPWYGTALAMFDTLTFTEPGTYTFYIREVKGQDPGIIYDSHVETVTVRVTDNGNGTLSTEVIYSDGIGALFNNHVLDLPSTGGRGVGLLAASGAVLLGMGVLLILYRRKRIIR